MILGLKLKKVHIQIFLLIFTSLVIIFVNPLGLFFIMLILILSLGQSSKDNRNLVKHHTNVPTEQFNFNLQLEEILVDEIDK